MGSLKVVPWIHVYQKDIWFMVPTNNSASDKRWGEQDSAEISPGLHTAHPKPRPRFSTLHVPDKTKKYTTAMKEEQRNYTRINHKESELQVCKKKTMLSSHSTLASVKREDSFCPLPPSCCCEMRSPDPSPSSLLQPCGYGPLHRAMPSTQSIDNREG